MNTPLHSYLAYKLSGVEVTDETLSKPLCGLCDTRGGPGDEFVIDEGERVLACACWEELSGWELFSVYHAQHGVSEVVTANPPKPTAILKGRIKKTDNKTNGGSKGSTYTVASLSLESVNYPSSLDPR